MVGQKFGRLTIIERDLSKKIGYGNDVYWICQCECGNKTSVRTTDLKANCIISYGCYRTDLLKQRNTLDLTNQCFGK